MFSVVTSLLLIVMGLRAKYSTHDGWSRARKYWKQIVIAGIVCLCIDICVYFGKTIGA